MPKRGKPPISQDVKNRIYSLAAAGVKARAIAEKLQLEGVKIHERSVHRFLRDRRIDDDSSPWTAAGKSAEDVVLLLPMVRAVAEVSEGRVRLTETQAALVLKVFRIVPDLPPWGAYELVLAYQRRQDQDAEDLDSFLAFAPWRGHAAYVHFCAWVGRARPEWTAGALPYPLSQGKKRFIVWVPAQGRDGLRIANAIELDRYCRDELGIEPGRANRDTIYAALTAAIRSVISQDVIRLVVADLDREAALEPPSPEEIEERIARMIVAQTYAEGVKEVQDEQAQRQ